MVIHTTSLGRYIGVVLIITLCIVVMRMTLYPGDKMQDMTVMQEFKSSKPGNIRRVKIHSQGSLYIPQDSYREGLEETSPVQSNENKLINISERINPSTHIKPPFGRSAWTSPSSNFQSHVFHELDKQKLTIVYSAHYDSSSQRITVIGFGPIEDDSNRLERYRCKLRREDGSLTLITQFKAHYRISTYLPWEGQTYDSYIYTCGLAALRPHSISIVSTEDITTDIKLTFEPAAAAQSSLYKLSVCVEPLVLNYNNTALLKNFLSVNIALGAEHFYFYVTNASAEVTDILNSHQSIVTIYNWPLGNLISKTHAYGQKAANNHCLYAHKTQSQYLVYIDIDEVLVPNHGQSWQEMMAKVNEEYPNNGAVVFQSKLFPLNQPKAKDQMDSQDLISLTHRKTIGTYPYHQWSKVMLDTSRASVMDIHHVRQLITPYTAVYSNSTYGYIHHYRQMDISMAHLISDDGMLAYRNKIISTYKAMFPT